MMSIIYTYFKEHAPVLSLSLHHPFFVLFLPRCPFLPFSFLLLLPGFFFHLPFFFFSHLDSLSLWLARTSRLFWGCSVLDGPLHPALSSLMLLQGEAPREGAMVVGPEVAVSGWPLGCLAWPDGGGQGWGRGKSPSGVWAEWAGLAHAA